MDKMRVTFELNAKSYSGFFSKVSGSGSTATFHLIVDGFYWGRLRFSELNNSWCFDPTPKTKGLEKLADEFGDFIIAWYQ